MKWNILRDDAFCIAKEHGWHDEEKSNEHYIVMIMTELAEAVEADRKDKRADVETYRQMSMYALRESRMDSEALSKYEKELFENNIKDTVEDELSDVIIRVLDFAGLNDIDLVSVDRMQEDGYYIDCPEVIEDFADQSFTSVIYELTSMLFNCIPYPEEVNERRLKRFLCYLMFYCQRNEIQIEWFVKKKMEYNKTRAFKHGKNY